MKNALLLALVIVLGSVLAACAPKPASPAADGKALYNYITQENNYKKWQFWPGKGEYYHGPEPHGPLLTTYTTADVISAIKSKKGVLPDGSIIVKENYKLDKTLAAVTVMYKVKGYNPAGDDWFWLKFAPDGKIELEGKVQMCIECHGKASENDFIMTSVLK